jgi:small conductance mechanosensitive channel
MTLNTQIPKMDFANLDTNQITDVLINLAQLFALNLIGAIVTFLIGRMIIKRVVKLVKITVEKKEFDPIRSNFLINLIKISLNVVLLVAVAGILGISTASLVTMLGAAGLAIGLALQGSLSNVAGGFLILLLKPFKEGDWIEAQGVMGAVNKVNILNTVLKTGDNKTIYLPNSALSNGNITNYTQEEFRRLDLTFSISYADEIDKAKAILRNIMETEPRIDLERNNRLAVSNLNDSSVDFTFRVWCKTEHYWDLNFDLIERVKKEFDSNSITIPFPQRDVHLYNK